MELTLPVTLAVLGAAFLHATWNAMIKGSRDVLLDTALVAAGASALALPLLPLLPLPMPASWPFLFASMVIHVCYYIALVGAYRAGDLAHGYPLMRGAAPLLVAVFGVIVLRETPTLWTWISIGCISCGILSIGFIDPRLPGASPKATFYALGNAIIIAAYTLVDGIGVRLAGHAPSYVVWLFFLQGLPFVAIVLWLRRREFVRYAARYWTRGLASGLCLGLSYGIALWAMTRAPVAAVAALRETSLIFAALLGAGFLGERFGRGRLIGTAVVAAGVIALRA